MSWEDARWLAELRREDGVEWLEAQERGEIEERVHALYASDGHPLVSLTQPAVALSRMMVGRLVPVARGPELAGRLEVAAPRPLLFVERDAPRHVLVALGEGMPPLMWFPGGTTRAELGAALEPYTRPWSPTLALPKQRRGFVGTEELLGRDFEGVVTHLSSSPFVESFFWGSAYDEDPWPESVGSEDVAALAARGGAYMAQRDGAVRALTCRAVASGASVTLEDRDGVFVAHARWSPAPHGAILGALNEQFGASMPTDWPLDLAAAMLGLFFSDVPWLQGAVAASAGPDELAANLYVLGCVLGDELDVVEVMRPWASHDHVEVRAAALDVTLRLGIDALAMERLAREPDEELRGSLIERLGGAR